MSTYSVTIAITTDQHLDDDQARDVAARWAAAAGFDLGMTSTSRDEPWLRVSGIADVDKDSVADIGRVGAARLADALGTLGASVAEWQAIEVWSAAELERRRQRPAIPPMVTAAELAVLAGFKSVQRIYQLDSERKSGKRDDFPAPVLEGYWLRTVGEHWASTRKRKPGPTPRQA